MNIVPLPVYPCSIEEASTLAGALLDGGKQIPAKQTQAFLSELIVYIVNSRPEMSWSWSELDDAIWFYCGKSYDEQPHEFIERLHDLLHSTHGLEAAADIADKSSARLDEIMSAIRVVALPAIRVLSHERMLNEMRHGVFEA